MIEILQKYSSLLRDRRKGPVLFAEKILGLPVTHHEGQVTWLANSNRRVNILRPGNRFGKSFVGAIKHGWHHFTKINIDGMYSTVDEWQRISYDTLNFGPAYEQAREILRLLREMIQGNIFIPDEFQDKYGVTNRSLLKDWFIVEDKSEAQALPYLKFMTGGSLLGRSYSDMGAAFKMKGIAYVSGDEVGDIPELWTFTNGTLLPRIAQYKNSSIDYYGTPQSEGHDYLRMIEMAEEDMARINYKEDGMFYVQKGKMTQNPFLDRETVQAIARISDPVLKRQIVDGEHVQTGDKYFGYERVHHAVDEKLEMTSKGFAGNRYVVMVDFAGGESYWANFTVIQVIDYTKDPYRVVYFNRFKGGAVPIPMQYKLVEEVYKAFKEGGTGANIADVKLIIDGSALGGKNAKAFLKHLSPICYELGPKLKAEMLAATKTAFDGGQSEEFKRKIVTLPDGVTQDENPDWGLIRIPNIPAYINELTNYKLDDSKIMTDCVMSLAMGIYYLEMRRPKKIKRRMVAFDVLSL